MDGGHLDILDLMAARVIEVRTLLMALPPNRREDLRAITDELLATIARRIAAELPPSALAFEGFFPGRALDGFLSGPAGDPTHALQPQIRLSSGPDEDRG